MLETFYFPPLPPFGDFGGPIPFKKLDEKVRTKVLLFTYGVIDGYCQGSHISGDKFSDIIVEIDEFIESSIGVSCSNFLTTKTYKEAFNNPELIKVIELGGKTYGDFASGDKEKGGASITRLKSMVDMWMRMSEEQIDGVEEIKKTTGIEKFTQVVKIEQEKLPRSVRGKKETPQQVIAKIKTWKGYEKFDGTDIDFRTRDPEVFENHQSTILMEAVERGDVNVVKYLIQAGADVNAVNIGTQNTPLLSLESSLWEAESEEKIIKDIEISTELINAGANVNYLSQNDEFDEKHFSTPLIDACMNGRRELAKILIESGADVDLSWKDGLNAICVLDKESDLYIKILEDLIDAGANVNTCGGSALQSAIDESNAEAIELLCNAGARLDIKSMDQYYNNRTPFMSLLKGVSFDEGLETEEKIFLLFHKNVGDVTVQDNDGKNLLSYALDTYIGDNDFNLFVLDKILFNEGIDINQLDNDGNTNLFSLLLSIEEEGDSIYELYDEEKYKIESLLIAGSDTEIKNREGETPKIIAKRIGNEEIQSLLENPDGLINTENYLGRTPLFVACLQGHIEKIKWLINKGADVNAKNKCHKIPRGLDVHGTFVQTYDETVKPKLYTALMASQNLETIRMLIKAGADINQKDSDGNTALMLYEKDNWEEGAESKTSKKSGNSKSNKGTCERCETLDR